MSETVSRERDASRQADTRASAGLSVPAGPDPGRDRRRRRVLAGGAAAVVAAAGVTVAVTGPFAGAGHAGGGPAASSSRMPNSFGDGSSGEPARQARRRAVSTTR